MSAASKLKDGKPLLCRACRKTAEETDEMIALFSKEKHLCEFATPADLFSKYTFLMIPPDEGMYIEQPSLCIECYEILRDFHKFREMCVASHYVFLREKYKIIDCSVPLPKLGVIPRVKRKIVQTRRKKKVELNQTLHQNDQGSHCRNDIIVPQIQQIHGYEIRILSDASGNANQLAAAVEHNDVITLRPITQQSDEFIVPDGPDTIWLNSLDQYVLGNHTGTKEIHSTSTDSLVKDGNEAIASTSIATDDRDKQVNVCTVCGWEAAGLTELESHMKKHRQWQEYPCPECCKVFYHKDSLPRHIRVNHANALAVDESRQTKLADQLQDTCMIPDAQFTGLLEHNRVQTDVHFKQTEIAGAIQIVNANSHAGIKMMETNPMKRKTELVVQPYTSAAKTENRQLVCNTSRIMKRTEKELNLQANILAKEKPYVCNICSCVFYSPMSFDRHFLRNHSEFKEPGNSSTDRGVYTVRGETEVNEETQQRVKCPNCFKVFHRNSLKRHIRVKHANAADQSLASDVCMMYDAQFTDVRKHNKLHTEQLSIQYWPTMASKNADNILVQRLESKSQPSDICMMCNVQFTNVLEHNKVHTEQFLIHYRPKMTLKNATKQEQRAEENRIHLICHVCHKLTNCKGTLRTHLNRHYGIRDHKCPQCTMQYVSQSEVNRHMKTHCNDKEQQQTPACISNIDRAHLTEGTASVQIGNANNVISCGKMELMETNLIEIAETIKVEANFETDDQM